MTCTALLKILSAASMLCIRARCVMPRARDGRSCSADEPESEEEEADDAVPGAPRRPRRAEIDPATMSDEERAQLQARVQAQVRRGPLPRGAVIAAQVEFYFGDPHYPKDAYMLQQAGKHAEGFIPINVVMSFKKMRRLTQFTEFIAATMQGSKVVQVSADGLMLRRVAPLPKDYEDALTRTVLLERLPPVRARGSPAGTHAVQRFSVEELQDKCALFGTVDQVRLLRRNDPYPDDINKYIMKGFRAKIPPGLFPNARPIALVEFATLDAAVAFMIDASTTEWRAGIQCSILYRKSKGKKKKKASPTKSVEWASSQEARASRGGTCTQRRRALRRQRRPSSCRPPPHSKTGPSPAAHTPLGADACATLGA